MTAEQIVWSASTALFGLLVLFAGYALRSRAERMEKDIQKLYDYVSQRYHALSNQLSEMLPRAEFREEVHQLKQDIRDIEQRIERLFNK